MLCFSSFILQILEIYSNFFQIKCFVSLKACAVYVFLFIYISPIRDIRHLPSIPIYNFWNFVITQSDDGIS